MAKRTISAEKLASMAKEGASVSSEDGRLNTVISSEINRMAQEAELEKIRTELELRENDLDRREAEYRIRLAALKDKGEGLTEISGFDGLLSKFDTMAETNDARAKADLARAQSQLEVLATLQAMVKALGNAKHDIDLAPIKTVLTELQQAQTQPRQAFEFDIERTNGFMTKIVATPVVPIKH